MKRDIERVNYYSDPRVQESMRNKYFKVVSIDNCLATIKLTRFAIEVASDCDPEDFPDWYDDEFWEDDYDYQSGESRYFSGVYDVNCSSCNGTKFNHDVHITNTSLREWIHDMEDEDDSFLQEQLAELRYGC
jgi:hypothetical protein